MGKSYMGLIISLLTVVLFSNCHTKGELIGIPDSKTVYKMMKHMLTWKTG